jgi:hypothetical protein
MCVIAACSSETVVHDPGKSVHVSAPLEVAQSAVVADARDMLSPLREIGWKMIELEASVRNVLFYFRAYANCANASQRAQRSRFETSTNVHDEEMKILVAPQSCRDQYRGNNKQQPLGAEDGRRSSLRAASCANLNRNAKEPSIIPRDTSRDRGSPDPAHLVKTGREFAGLPFRDRALRDLGNRGQFSLREAEYVLADEA